ncbi:hypothetical protein TNCV_3226551 [Trichonephila clavipes]|nr:hypothetical protein TNCV_3226551 [Trichonephila clavipes]
MLPVLGKKGVLEWCMKEGLIGSSYVCPKCGKSMELRERMEWLMVATRLMKTLAPKPEQNTFRQNVPIRPRQNTFVPQNRYSFRPIFQNFNRMRPQHRPNHHAHNFNNRGFRPNHHTHFQHVLPPYPWWPR